MMLNEKALLIATKALSRSVIASNRARITIKAYIAALPDEGEMVAKLRQRCAEEEALLDQDGSISQALDVQLWRDAADALEVARVKLAAAPEVSDDR